MAYQLDKLEVAGMTEDGTPLITLESLHQWSHLPVTTIFEQKIIHDLRTPVVRLDDLTDIYNFLPPDQQNELTLILNSFYAISCECAMHTLNRSISLLWFQCLSLMLRYPDDYAQIIDQFAHDLKTVIYNGRNKKN